MRNICIWIGAAFLTVSAAQAQNVLITKIGWERTYTTQRVTDLAPGLEDGAGAYGGFVPSDMIVYNGALYFAGSDGQSGVELWRYDGANVSLVADLYPGPESSNPGYFAVMGGLLYFTANMPSVGYELMRSNGSAIAVAADIDPGLESSRPMQTAVHKGALYFTADDGAHGPELWRFDGVNATMVQDLRFGPIGAFDQIINGNPVRTDGCCLSAGDNLFFFANRNDGAGIEPHIYNGNSIVRIANIRPGAADAFTINDDFEAAYLDGVVYFPERINPGQTYSNVGLWRYDGSSVTVAAEAQVGQPYHYPRGLTVFGDALYFSANIGSYDLELLKFAPASGVSVAAELPGEDAYYAPGPFGALLPNRLTGETALDDDFGPLLFFSASCCDTDPSSLNNTDRELFVYDGQGAKMAANVNKLPVDVLAWPSAKTGRSIPFALTPWGNWIYYFAQDADHGYELWRTRPSKQLNIYIAIGRAFDRWWEWPIDWIDRPALTAVYAFTPGGEQQLLFKKELEAGRLNPLSGETAIALRLDAAQLPETFALATFTFDARSGERLTEEIAVIGGQSDPLRQLAATRSKTLNLSNVRAQRVARGVAVELSRKQDVRPQLERAPASVRQIQPVQKQPADQRLRQRTDKQQRR